MEDEIRDLMHKAAPKPSDPENFLLNLNARLAAVEQVKAYRDRENRRSRRTMCVVFASGMLIGVMLILLMSLLPNELPRLQDIIASCKLGSVNGELLSRILTVFGAIAAATAIILPLSIVRR